MFSLGRINSKEGCKTKVSLLEEQWNNYILVNPEEVPKNYQSNLGLFQYEPQDQFCRWVNMNQIELKKC